MEFYFSKKRLSKREEKNINNKQKNIFFFLKILTCLLIFSKTIQLDLNKLNNVLLEQHNKYRKLHTVANLTLDEELIQIAQDHSETLANNDDKTYIASSGNKNKNKEILGENIFSCGNLLKTQPACYNEESTKPVDDWYGEISEYNYDDPGFTIGSFHFTQVIWKSTTKVGCGASIRKDGVTYKVVCNYYPAGNLLSKASYEENVLPAKPVENSSIIHIKYFYLFITILIIFF